MTHDYPSPAVQKQACMLAGATLEEPLRRARSSLANAKLDLSNRQTLVSAMLALTIVDLVSSASCLLLGGCHRGVVLIQRSALEALVDLKNLTQDEDYIAQIQLQEIQHVKNSDWAFKKGENRYVARVSELQKEALRHASDREEEIRSSFEQQRPMRLHEKFRLAGMEDEYDAIYARWSEEAHNGLSTLAMRHVEAIDAEKPLLVASTIYRSEVATFVQGFSRILLLAVTALHQLAGQSTEALETAVKTADEEARLIALFRSTTEGGG